MGFLVDAYLKLKELNADKPRSQNGGTPEQAVAATHQPADPTSNLLEDGTYASAYRAKPKK